MTPIDQLKRLVKGHSLPSGQVIGQLYKDESRHIRKLFDSIIRSVWYFSEETAHHIRHQTSDPDCFSLGGEALLFLTAQGGRLASDHDAEEQGKLSKGKVMDGYVQERPKGCP